MIIKRQKHFSNVWSNTLNWSKGLVKRGVSFGRALFLVWKSVTKDLFSQIQKRMKSETTEKHSIGNAVLCKDHAKRNHIATPITKSFSNVSIDADFDEYCRVIPGYAQIVVLSDFNFELLKNLPEQGREMIWKLFPSFMVVMSPDKIKKYREDYLSSKEYPGDYAEILFTFGSELVYLYDFDKENWYVRDRTYNSHKEWIIKDNDILGALLINFDPDKNHLLKKRLEVWNKDYRDTFDMETYCKILLDVIKKVKK